MNGLPYELLAPGLVNTACSIVFSVLPEMARQPISEVHAKAASLARFISCPTCHGSGMLLHREGMVNIHKSPCPTCHGEGTADSAMWEARAQNITLERTIAAMTDNQNKLLKRLTEMSALEDSELVRSLDTFLSEVVGPRTRVNPHEPPAEG